MASLLRCAGCGIEVSEWAARCPECKHSTDDAVLVATAPPPDRGQPAESAGAAPVPAPAAPTAGAAPVPAPAAPTAGAAPVPAPAAPTAGAAPDIPAQTLPAPHRLRTRPAIVVTLAVVVTAVAGGLLGLRLTVGGSAPAHHAGPLLPPSTAAGRIVVQEPNGTLALVDPVSDRVVWRDSPGALAGEVVMTAPDRRFVATLRGDVLAVNNVDGLDQTDIPSVTKAALLGGPDTFAARDQAVIVVASSGQQARTSAVSALTLADRRSVALGVADEAAGDPAALGVFVSVPVPGASSVTPAAGTLGLRDSRVELRDAGQPAQVVATAAQLNAYLGQAPDRHVHLSVFPNPTGTAVAIALNPPAGNATNVGVVVLDRRGHLLGVVPTAIGPFEYTWPSWSPDGRALAYSTVGPEGTSLAIWREAGPPLIRTAPDNRARFGYCLWAPDGSAILCPTSESARDNWDQGAVQGGPLFAVPAPGTPIVWLARGAAP